MILYDYYSSPEILFGYDQIISIIPKLAYQYAKETIKGRFPEGEKAIATSSYHAYLYAVHVIRGRFPLGEPEILKSNYKDQYLSFIKDKE